MSKKRKTNLTPEQLELLNKFNNSNKSSEKVSNSDTSAQKANTQSSVSMPSMRRSGSRGK
jgi:hypothetical protein